MIEINLVPDVKMELLRAERMRTTVISICTIVAIGSGALVVLMGMYVMGAQAVLKNEADKTITREFNNLKSKSDLDKVLTIQNQLAKISQVHVASPVNSRVFDVVSMLVQSSGHGVNISKVRIDNKAKTITLEGQSPEGYLALEAFKKTILKTKFEYSKDKKTETEPLTTQVNDGERSYGQDTSGVKVMRFTVNFVYSDALLSRESASGRIVAPEATNVTDSKLGVPESLFTAPAAPVKEGGSQ
jgi:hypothetical protein